jgi:thioredoxin 1
MNNTVATFRDQNWDDDVLHASGPVLVDFWADWCAPCKMMAPTVEALAEEFQGRVRFGKLDIDESPRTAERYDIRGVPTLILFQGGQPKARVVGVTSREELSEWILGVVGSSQ